MVGWSGGRVVGWSGGRVVGWLGSWVIRWLGDQMVGWFLLLYCSAVSAQQILRLRIRMF